MTFPTNSEANCAAYKSLQQHSLAKDIADRMIEKEAEACNPVFHPYGAKDARKKVGKRILDDMQKDHPDYPWQ